MYKRVLVATGGSPWSDAAVSYAIAWAACRGAELRILSVLASPVAYTMPDVILSSELLMASIERQGQEILDRVAAQAERAGVSYSTLLKWGNVPATILQTAVEEDCEIITLGSRVVTGLKRLAVGRTLNAVAAKAHHPVLIIKHPPDARAVPVLWRRILVATGGSPWSDVAVDHALHLARALDLAVCLLCIDSGRARSSLSSATSEAKNTLALAEARAAAAGVTYEAHLGYGNIAETIREAAASRACDAIILGSRGLTGFKRLMLGSISNAVAAKTLLPVLIVKRFFPA
jgi:nucleotide-binding universal stress UspA family protein